MCDHGLCFAPSVDSHGHVIGLPQGRASEPSHQAKPIGAGIDSLKHSISQSSRQSSRIKDGFYSRVQRPYSTWAKTKCLVFGACRGLLLLFYLIASFPVRKACWILLF